ncbi:hypothetical protein CBER1_04219 [Cercospora berteroae]|uniref:ATP phosphoribosyltransferase n=1 Tax=Cercospora berteroae TaxID=357750 RepID=A0A2S6CHW0_9PEZI|nr:hypothetical protein CBER1_04219 [Cercospora berteroae]
MLARTFIQTPLSNLRPFTRSMASSTALERYKLIFFAPPQDLPKIKEAIFAAGAGRYPGPGGYTECGFATPGVGQFRPGDSANPHIGEKGKVEEVGEVRFETICVGTDVAKAAVEALKK